MLRPGLSRQISRMRDHAAAKRRRRLRFTLCAGAGLFTAALLTGTFLISPRADRVAPAGTASAASEPTAATTNRVAAVWRPNVKAAEKFARGRSGLASFSVVTNDSTWASMGLQEVPLASTAKVLLMTALLRENRSSDLDSGVSALLSSMIRYSDNDAADSVLALAGFDGVHSTARAGGIKAFDTGYAWGLSRAGARELAGFMWRLPGLVPKRHRDTALGELASISESHRWGVARIAHPGWSLHFKGGWGITDGMSGTVHHQIALLRKGPERIGLAILTQGNPSHEYGVKTIEGLARTLLRGLPGQADPRLTSERG